MYKILKNGEAIAETNDLATAVSIIRMLESKLNRLTQHSPYTIG